MKISTFRGVETRDVLQQVKEALGEDAVILSTRRVREKSAKTGLPTGPVLIEVTACPGSKPKGIDSRARVVVEDLPLPPSVVSRSGEPQGESASARRGRFSTVVDDTLEPSLSGVRAREERPYVPVAEPPVSRFGRVTEEPPAREEARPRDEEPPRRAQDPPRRTEEPRRFEEPPPRRTEEPRRFEEPPARRTEEPRRFEEPPARRTEEPRRFEEPPARRTEEPRRFEEPPPRRAEEPRRTEEPPPRRSEEPRRFEETFPAEEPRSAGLALDLSNIRDTLAHLEERVSNLPEVMAQEMQKIPDIPGLDAEGKRRYGWLLMHGVEDPIARKLAMVERAVKDGGMEMALRRFLNFRDPLNGNARVIVVVGPTGVGKTTTLAKIAAELLLNRRRSVGFITLDTFRVGAVAQLETYARLLQVRLVVARSPSEVKAGLQSLGRCDHVLVDTVGSSPYNRRQVNSTGELLPMLGEDREVLLCMAGNVRETEQKAIYRRFADLNPTGLIFTKLDETVTYGGVLNVALRSRLPLTFYTNGQRVPENLGWLTPEVMSRWFEQVKK